MTKLNYIKKMISYFNQTEIDVIRNEKNWPKNRSEVIRDEAKQLTDYTCEVNEEHKSFISERTGKNYVISHYLIPMEFQKCFPYNLDVVENIVTVCPNCHAMLHYAYFTDKQDMLRHLYDIKKRDLWEAGLRISLCDLYNYYLNSK